jgi:uncharacterized protein (TIGR02145 family)
MKNRIRTSIYLFILTSLSLSSLISCDEEDPMPPELSTSVVIDITYKTAVSGGTIASDGGTSIISRGVCWSTNPNPTISDSKTSDGSGTGTFASNITGLTSGTTYHLRAYATNSVGTAYGNEVVFATIPTLVSELTTSSVTTITYTTATSGGVISSDGGEVVTARGVCWSVNANPTISDSKTSDGSGTGTFVSNLTGLTQGTTYYLRAYATNSVGTAYGNEVVFKTIPTSITDIDGNVYQTVIIGNQVWLKENLKTTKYRNGDLISNVPIELDWAGLSTGAYSFYSNNSSNNTIYGSLYNWFAVNDSRKIAPTGWHIPSEAEWTILQNFLGGELSAGGKLKETGLAHWQSPNEGATNETGFTALPGGYRDITGSFSNLGYKGVWWSASEKSSNTAYALFTYAEGTQLHGEPNEKRIGFSIRCIMD